MKKNIPVIAASFLSISLLVVPLVASSFNNADIAIGDTNPYTLSLNNNQKITTATTPSEELVSGYVETTLGNKIQLDGMDIIDNNSGWQSILPGGYFYNPVTSKIKGISSIKYVGNSSLEMHYGYAPNDEEIIYSTAINLTANSEYLFDNRPSYIYLKNAGNSNVDITSLSISYSCEEQDYPNNNLKVLMIGNSFADDTVYYLERIANSIGINIEFYDAYIAGCTIDTHYSNIKSGATSYSMRSMIGASWNYQNNMSLGDIVTYKPWDIITFQQASAAVGRNTSYGNLINLVNEVKARVTGTPKYYWHQTWAYDNDYSEYYDYFSYFNNDQVTMFNAIVDCYNSCVASTNLFEKTIFNGTAIQDIRTSYMGDNFSRDGKHVSHVHGRYTLSANFLATAFDIDFELTPINYLPDGMNRSFLKLLNETIKNVRKNPLAITNSQLIDEDIAEYDLNNYEEIDAGLVGCSFYNCTDSSKYNIRINHTQDTSNKYVTSYRFTQSMLPIGSIIYCREGYGYRPEAWINDSVQSSRKSETSQNILVVDNEFWNGYQYRAFNIFKSGKLSLSGQYVDEQYDEIFDAFHIYVPKDKMGGLTPKTNNPYYYSDSNRFNNYGKNIDDYHRLHLDPITGFYKCDELYYLMNKYVDNTAQKFVCTRPFYTNKNDLPAGSIILLDSGYQWRSDCWGAQGTYSPRPNNVQNEFYVVDSSFTSPFRRRTFNISKTNGQLVGQDSIDFMNHFRIYVPNN